MAKSIKTIYESRLRQSRNLSESHWQRAIDNYKHYFGRLDAGGVNDENYPFYSKMSMSISYEIIETVMPRMIGKDPEFSFIAQEPSDVQYEDLARLTVDSQYNNPKLELLGEPIYLKLQRMVKEALITGNAVGRPMWRRQTKQIVKYVASLDRAGFKNEKDIQKVVETAMKLGKEDEVKYGKEFAESPWLDDFDITHKPFYHYFPDAIMVEPGRFRFQIERDLMTFEELEDEAKRFGYDEEMLKEIKDNIDKGKSAGYNPQSDSQVTKDFMYEYNDLFAIDDQRAFTTDDDKIPLLRVDKMWDSDGKVHVFVDESKPMTGDGEDAGIENPYDVKKPPFIHVHDVVIPHSYYSRGEIDAIKKLEDGANDLMNMRFDNLLQAMLNYWLYNPKMMADNDEFVPIPNTTTAVKDIDKAVRVISGNDVTASSYREAEMFTGMIKSISGLGDYVQGEEGASVAGRTYGGMRLAQEVANARFIVKSRLFEKVTLKALGYFMLEFARQFISEDRIKRISGDLGEIMENKISVGGLKSIAGFMDMKVVPNSSAALDQQAEAMKLNAVSDRFSTEKGAFKDIPDEVYDKFLLKYLLSQGITDAVYWVRARAEAREKAKAQPQPAPETVPNAPAPAPGGMPIPQGLGGQLPTPQEQMLSGIAPTTQGVLQSDQVAEQPDPLQQIIAATQLG